MKPFCHSYHKVIYILSLTGLCLSAVGYFALSALGISLSDIVGQCALYTLTGLYCPGCGGTRAIVSLIHLHPLESFIYHPLVLYTAVVMGAFVISFTASTVSRGRVGYLKLRPIYLYIALAIIAVNWVVKNILILNGVWK